MDADTRLKQMRVMGWLAVALIALHIARIVVAIVQPCPCPCEEVEAR